VAPLVRSQDQASLSFVMLTVTDIAPEIEALWLLIKIATKKLRATFCAP
jgi:hypothetical protein